MCTYSVLPFIDIYKLKQIKKTRKIIIRKGKILKICSKFAQFFLCFFSIFIIIFLFSDMVEPEKFPKARTGNDRMHGGFGFNGPSEA